MKYSPQIATIRLTCQCNNNCKYCLAPKKMREMNFLKLKKIFNLIYSKGVRAIVLTGGEPLLRNDFLKIINELKKYNFKIFLDTNGDLFFKFKGLISKYVDVLGLPIDFPDSSYRNKNNLKKVIEVLNFYKNTKIRPTIRIGTVITKDNLSKLEKIGNLIKNYPVDIWKIYEFTPQNINAIKHKKSLEISTRDFIKITKKIKEKFSKYFKIVISKREDRNKAYFFIGSDGIVFMPFDNLNICREVKIGSIFDKDIFDKWKKFVSKNKYIDNAQTTFNYKILRHSH